MNAFQLYIAAHEPFWLGKNPSGILDQLLATPNIKKSLKKCQPLLNGIEHSIITTYVKIINSSLREAFSQLTYEDLLTPKGFISPAKASKTQSNYYMVCNAINDLVKFDILQHDSSYASLNSLRRWIDIADVLYRQGCYEGMNTIIATLNSSEFSRFDLFELLPQEQQQRFEFFTNLISPVNNYIELRKLDGIYSNSKTMLVMSLYIKDSIYIDAQIENTKFGKYEVLKPTNSMIPLIQKKIRLLSSVRAKQSLNIEPLNNIEQEIIAHHMQRLSLGIDYYQQATDAMHRFKCDIKKKASYKLYASTKFKFFANINENVGSDIGSEEDDQSKELLAI